MKIGILQTGHSPEGLVAEYGDYGDMFVNLLGGEGFDFEIYSIVDGVFPPNAEAADGWLITGSRHGAYEDLPWIPPLEALVREIYALGRPLIGICVGHQIIAQALGGRVAKYPDGWSVGATDYRLSDGREITLNAWHQDQVTERPEDATVIASSPFCANAVLAYGDKVLTIQAHPEFGSAFVEQLVEKRGRGLVPDALLGGALDRRKTPISQPWAIKEMVRFFKQPRV